MSQAATATAQIIQDDEMNCVYLPNPERSGQELPGLIQRLLEQLDGTRHAAAALQKAQISESRGTAIFRKLTQQGFIIPVDPALAEADTLPDLPSLKQHEADFTDEELAFFEAEPEAAAEPSRRRWALGLLWSDMVLRLNGWAL